MRAAASVWYDDISGSVVIASRSERNAYRTPVIFLNSDERVERSGYEHYSNHQETLRQLTAHGDTLMREVIIPTEEIHAIDQEFIESIRKRATRLAELHPEAAEALLGYVKNQELESHIIETMLTGAVWLLGRA